MNSPQPAITFRNASAAAGATATLMKM
jgi:hypothetical protein